MAKIDVNRSSKYPVPALIAAVIALILWTGTAIANKIAVEYMDGLTAGVLRSLLAGCCALLIAIAMKLPFPNSNRDRTLLFLSGLLSFAVWPMTLSIGIARTTAGHAALIMAMIPVLTVMIASLIRRRVPGPGWWLGAMIALLATVFLITNRGYSLEMFDDGSSMIGDLIILMGCLSCAGGYVAGGKLSPKIGTAATTFWSLSMALIVLVPAFSLIYQGTAWEVVPARGWMAIAWMTFFSSLAGYALWFYALGKGEFERISSLQLIMPVSTLVAAALLLNENIGLLLGLVCSCIIGGTYLAQRYAK